MVSNRKYNKKRTYKKKTYSNYRLSKDVMYLKSIMNSEPKYHLLQLGIGLDDAGRIDSLSNIPQGDTHIQRNANSVLPRYLSIQATFVKNVNASASDFETFKVIIFRYWGEATSAAPNVTPSEVLEQVSHKGFLNDDNTGKRRDRERRIEVHRSMYFTLDKIARTSKNVKINIKVNGPTKAVKDHIKFRSSTTEQPVSGGFYLLTITDNPDISSYKATLDWSSKLVFYDN